MQNSKSWSNASAPCRLEWRPSRLLAASLAVLGAMAGVGAVTSELPLGATVLLAMASMVLGLRHTGTEMRRPVRELVIPCSPVRASVDGIEVDDLQVRWRGPLAFLSWRDARGCLHRLHGWPDNLDASARRELRLAMLAREPAPSRRSMAP